MMRKRNINPVFFPGKRTRRFKRSKNSNAPQLSQEDILYLQEHTRYDEKEIKEWFMSVSIKSLIFSEITFRLAAGLWQPAPRGS